MGPFLGQQQERAGLGHLEILQRAHDIIEIAVVIVAVMRPAAQQNGNGRFVGPETKIDVKRSPGASGLVLGEGQRVGHCATLRRGRVHSNAGAAYGAKQKVEHSSNRCVGTVSGTECVERAGHPDLGGDWATDELAERK